MSKARHWKRFPTQRLTDRGGGHRISSSAIRYGKGGLTNWDHENRSVRRIKISTTKKQQKNMYEHGHAGTYKYANKIFIFIILSSVAKMAEGFFGELHC